MKDKIIVEKILKYISKVLEYTKDTTYDDFINNSILVEACVFNLSQIGELPIKLTRILRIVIRQSRGELCTDFAIR